VNVAKAHALGGGGRYDDLIGALGGKRSTPAIGFAYGLDHVARLLPGDFAEDDLDGPVQVLVTAQETAFSEAVATAERLRAQGIPAELDLESKSDAAAARYARQRGIETIMRVGQDGRVAEQFV
jgi:histidyl-tRNA synthetase